MPDPFINQFKSQLTGGGARSNLYRVNGTFPAASVAAAGKNPAEQIQFLCSAASLPQITLAPITVNFQGRPFKLAGEREFPEWTITVINDTNFGLRNAFEKWSDVINNIESNGGRANLAEYAQQWTVTQLDRSGNDVKSYVFVDCWPSAISAIDLSYEPATVIETFNVTLQYQYYQSSAGVSS